ncbi:conserved hypothetical protein [Methylocella silvestris BL2]|uniref:Uncharacterized protein n=1 Tax=Methylocella silvestris (strain DSM 15510 / CIP 108128 / LMG 27833 / NCIMB 13906 / BL2) TaxID=395965 RepID=B8EJL8_METSB|nr:conserved hypothetical protein [Methylocella silvestris BL2]
MRFDKGKGAAQVAALLCLALLTLASPRPSAAQTPPAAPSAAPSGAPPADAGAIPPLRLPAGQAPAKAEAVSGNILHLTAYLSATDAQPLRGGVHWRVFNERVELDGSHVLVAESTDSTPALTLPDGAFIVHAAFGLAGATKRVTIEGKGVSERVALNAGALRIMGLLGDAPLPATKSQISVYVPERNNSEAKLVANIKSGETIGLPEGNYHVVSTLLDPQTTGAVNPTNSVINADLRVQAGKLTDASLRHRAATMTLKLVSGPSGEALANTSFTILTPGGDVIREMIGAFPSLVLAEGEYVAIARHDNNVYQTNFKVESTLDRDVEVLAK